MVLFLNPNIIFLGGKTVTGSFETKFVLVLYKEKHENSYKKRRNKNVKKQKKKKCISFTYPKDHSAQKIRFLAQKLLSDHTHIHAVSKTDRQT